MATIDLIKKPFKRGDFNIFSNDFPKPNENRFLVVFVHGLGGSNDESYWNQIPRLLRFEQGFDDVDFAFWRYPTNRKAFSNLFSLLRGGLEIAPIPMVAGSLQTGIDELVFEARYKGVYLIGHSLGGAIAILATEFAASRSSKSVVRSIYLTATPSMKHQLASRAAIIFRWNPHIAWLGSSNLTQLFQNSLPKILKMGVVVFSRDAARDEVVAHSAAADPHDAGQFDGIHNWPSDVSNRNSAGYRSLITWLLKQVILEREAI